MSAQLTSLCPGMFSYHFPGTGGSQLDDAAPHSHGDRLSAVFGAELLHDVLDMNLDRLLRDKQEFGDLAIAIARGHPAQHLNLPSGEGLIAHMLCKLRRDFWRDSLISVVDLPDR